MHINYVPESIFCIHQQCFTIKEFAQLKLLQKYLPPTYSKSENVKKKPQSWHIFEWHEHI